MLFPYYCIFYSDYNTKNSSCLCKNHLEKKVAAGKSEPYQACVRETGPARNSTQPVQQKVCEDITPEYLQNLFVFLDPFTTLW